MDLEGIGEPDWIGSALSAPATKRRARGGVMTGDSNPPDMPGPSPQPEPSPVTDAMADAKAAFDRAGFATPTGMVALAGLILIGVEVIFGLMLNEYYLDYPVLLGAGVAAVIIFYANGAYDRIGPAPDLLKLAGMVIAALGVFTLIYDLRFASSRLDEFPEILGALFTYGAAILAFLGARSIET
jgi:hypothetical protein